MVEVDVVGLGGMVDGVREPLQYYATVPRLACHESLPRLLDDLGRDPPKKYSSIKILPPELSVFV